MLDDHDFARLDEIYVRKDDCQDIQSAYVEPVEPVEPAEPLEHMPPGELLVKIMNSTGTCGTWELVK